MKKIIYFIAIALMTPVLTGCEDFLDTRSYTRKDGSSFPKTEEDALQMVTGVYAGLLSYITGTPRSYFYIAELAADYRFAGGMLGTDHETQAIGHLLYNNLNSLNNFWRNHYTGVARANAALAALLEGMDDGPVKAQKVGEVKILRAYSYFEMVQVFGDVPIMKSAPENVAEAQTSPPQAPQDEVFQFIARDLWEAYNEMPDIQWNTYPSGVVSKWVAAGMLARVFLFYTGFYSKTSLPLEGGGEVTNAQVVDALKDCINNSGHGLVNDFRSLWPYSNKASKKDYPFAVSADDWNEINIENMFVIKMKPHDWSRFNTLAQYFSIRQGSYSNYAMMFPMGKGWGAGPVNTKLWDEWAEDAPDDLRRQASIWHYQHETVFDKDKNEVPAEYAWGSDSQIEETGLWQKKIVATKAYGKGPNGDELFMSFLSHPDFFNNAADEDQASHGTDVILLRFADVLLMHSELTKTADGMNRVRDRVGLPNVSYSEDALRKERLYELAFEGLRWGDIRRWHIAEEVLPKMYGVDIYVATTWSKMQEQGPNIADRYRATNGFFPIPTTQIDLSDGELKQNRGWEGDAYFNAATYKY